MGICKQSFVDYLQAYPPVNLHKNTYKHCLSQKTPNNLRTKMIVGFFKFRYGDPRVTEQKTLERTSGGHLLQTPHSY